MAKVYQNLNEAFIFEKHIYATQSASHCFRTNKKTKSHKKKSKKQATQNPKRIMLTYVFKQNKAKRVIFEKN